MTTGNVGEVIVSPGTDGTMLMLSSLMASTPVFVIVVLIFFGEPGISSPKSMSETGATAGLRIDPRSTTVRCKPHGSALTVTVDVTSPSPRGPSVTGIDNTLA